jgi:hypothetical protein
LHIDVEPATLNIIVTTLSKFKETQDGEDDIADVLVLEEGTETRGRVGLDDEIAPATGYMNNPLVGLFHRMHRGHDTQPAEEQAHNFNIWVGLAINRLSTTSFLSNWFGIRNPTVVRNEIATLLEMEAAWPQAMEAAYSKLWERIALTAGDNELFEKNTIHDLARHHLDRMVHRMSEESVKVLQRCVKDPDFKPDAANKLPFAEELYEMAFDARKWPTSLRCTWITTCVKGSLACSEEERAAEAVKRPCVVIDGADELFIY